MKATKYVAREPDANGHIHYPDAEHAVWQTLIERQLKLLDGRACQEYLDGIEQLALPHDRIPPAGRNQPRAGCNHGLAGGAGPSADSLPDLF